MEVSILGCNLFLTFLASKKSDVLSLYLNKRAEVFTLSRLKSLILIISMLGSIHLLAQTETGFQEKSASEKNLEYLPREDAAQLIKNFDSASAPALDELDGLELVCDMYGLQSRLQAEKSIRLYHFQKQKIETDKTTKKMFNFGAQITKEYKFEGQSLVALKGSLKDELKKISDQKWISKMTFKSPELKEEKVVAISVCQKPKEA